MSQYIKAMFKAKVPLWVSPGTLAVCLQPLLDAAGTTFEKAIKSGTLERKSGFVSLDLVGKVRDDFKEFFDQSCDELAQVASEAFETGFATDRSEKDINGEIFRRVVGPTSVSVERYKAEAILHSIERQYPGLIHDSGMYAGISAKDLITDPLIKTFTCAMVDSQGRANPLLSVNTRGLDERTRYLAISQALLSFRSMATHLPGLPMIVEHAGSGSMCDFELSPVDKARAVLGLGDWKLVGRSNQVCPDGCLEFTFVSDSQSKSARILLEQGAVKATDMSDRSPQRPIAREVVR